MFEFLLYIAIFLIVYGLLLHFLQKKKKPYDPFNPPMTMMTRIKCEDCGYTEYRGFERGDYVYKELECPKCGGRWVIDAIYVEYERNPKEITWENYCKRWR